VVDDIDNISRPRPLLIQQGATRRRAEEVVSMSSTALASSGRGAAGSASVPYIASFDSTTSSPPPSPLTYLPTTFIPHHPHVAWGWPDENTPIPAIFERTSIETVVPTKQAYVDAWTIERPLSPLMYSRIRPALIRAGQLLALSEKFFARITFAERKFFPDMHIRFLRSFFDPAYDGPIHAKEWKEFDKLLSNLPDQIRIVFSPFRRESNPNTPKGKRDPHGLAQRVSLHRQIIFLSSNYYHYFCHPDFETFEQKQVEIVLMTLAVTIVHELCHCFWFIRMSKETREGTYHRFDTWKEPYWRVEDPEREVGRAWEDWFFGGVVEMGYPLFPLDDLPSEEMLDRFDRKVFWVDRMLLFQWERVAGFEHWRGMAEKERRADDMVRRFWDEKRWEGWCEELRRREGLVLGVRRVLLEEGLNSWREWGWRGGESR
jgi:hypothetical protein